MIVVLCAQEELGEHTVHEVVVASPVTSFPGFPSFSGSMRANADFSPQIFIFFRYMQSDGCELRKSSVKEI